MIKTINRKITIKSLITTLIIAVAITAACSADVPIVRNGHFIELTDPNHPAEWTVSVQPSSGSKYFINVDKDSFNGAPALRLVGAAESGRAIAVQRNIPAEDLQGNIFEISAWYKGNEINHRSGAENFIRVEFFKQEDGGLKNTGGSNVTRAPSGTTEWTQLTNEFEVPVGTEIMWISISLRESSGTAWWSGIEINPLTPGVSTTEGKDQPVGSNQLPYRPADLDVVTTNPPSFVWVPVRLASSYLLEYSTDPHFSPPSTIQVDHVDLSIYTPTKLLDKHATWYWRVRGVTSSGVMMEPSATRAFRIAPQAVELPLPPMSEVRDRLPKSHPKLFVTPDQVDTWRDQASSNLLFKTLMSPIRTRALALLYEPLPDEPPHARPGGVWDVNLWRQYSITVRATDAMETLAFAYMITGDESFGEAARRWMLHIASWDPAGATSAAVNDESSMPILLKLSRAYTWAYGALSPEDRSEIQRVMRVRGTEAFNILKRAPFESNPYGSHQGRSLGFLGEAAIAFMDDIPEAKEWFDYVVRIFYAVYPAWGRDPGGWAEGHAYWTSYMNRVLWFVDALQAATGLNLYEKAFFQNTGMFKLYTQPPYSKMGPFGDFSDQGPTQAAGYVMAHFGNVYQNPYYRWYATRMGAIMETGVMGFIRAILHPVGEVKPKEPLDLPSSAYFPDIGWVAMHKRMGQADDSVQLLFKSSPYGSFSHSQADQNTFTLEAYGTPLLISSGYRPWHGSQHHVGWTETTRAQNGVLVEGKGQITRSLASKGEVVSFLHGDTFDYTAGDAFAAYGGLLDRYIRHIIYVRPDVFVIFDDLKAPKASSFSWLLHAYHEMDVDAPNGRIGLDANTATLDVRLWSSEGLSYDQTNEFAVPLDEPMNKPEQWHLTARTDRRTTDAYFLAVLTPSKTGEPRVIPATRLVADAGVGVRLVNNEEITTVLFRTKEEVAAADGLTIVGSAGALRRGDDAVGLLLADGTKLESEDGLSLVSTVDIDVELTITGINSGNGLDIRGTLISPSGPGSEPFDVTLTVPETTGAEAVTSSHTVLQSVFENGALRLRLDPGEHEVHIRLK